MWNRYVFYSTSIVQNADPASSLYSLQALDITCVTEGSGYLFFGDSEGGITICNQIYSLSRFMAHKNSVSFAYCCKSSNYLYTIGDCNEVRPEYVVVESRRVANYYRSILKKNEAFSWILEDLLLNNVVQSQSAEIPKHAVLNVWDLSHRDENGAPECVRSILLFDKMEEEELSFFTVLESEEMLLYGCKNGRIFYQQGNVIRMINTMVTLLPPHLSSSITGMYGCVTDEEERVIHLYVASSAEIGYYSFPCNTRSTIQYTVLSEEKGCEMNCCCINSRGEFIVGQDDEIVVYPLTGKSVHYDFVSKKKYLAAHKDCVVVGSFDENGQQVVTLYNMENCFVAYSIPLFRDGKTEFISSIITQDNLLFILSRSHTMFMMQEKDIQTKLKSLFEHHEYETALAIAQHNKMDYNSILDIHRIYGDYLYEEDRNAEAIKEYIHTIGYIEPSYVIKKFLDAQRMPQLAMYLEAMHQRGLANNEHTTLLINCYTKLNEMEKLHEFIYDDKADGKFDITIAIEVLRKASCYTEALHLSKKYNYRDTYVKIEIDDRNDYEAALEYIKSLPKELASASLQIYGRVILNYLRDDTATLLTSLCVPSEFPSPSPTPALSPLDDGNEYSEEDSLLDSCCEPSNFIQCFVDYPLLLKRFLKTCIDKRRNCDATVWNTCLELYLRYDLVEEECSQDQEKVYTEEERKKKYTNDVMDLLRHPLANYDVDQALVFVQMNDFIEGELYLYEKLHMYSMMVKRYTEINDNEGLIALCKQYGSEDKSLWIQLLSFIAEMETINMDQLNDLLKYIHDNQLVTPLMALQILSRNPRIQLKDMRSFILQCIQDKEETMKTDLKSVTELKQQTSEMQSEMEGIKQYPCILVLF